MHPLHNLIAEHIERIKFKNYIKYLWALWSQQ